MKKMVLVGLVLGVLFVFGCTHNGSETSSPAGSQADSGDVAVSDSGNQQATQPAQYNEYMNSICGSQSPVSLPLTAEEISDVLGVDVVFDLVSPGVSLETNAICEYTFFREPRIDLERLKLIIKTPQARFSPGTPFYEEAVREDGVIHEDERREANFKLISGLADESYYMWHGPDITAPTYFPSLKLHAKKGDLVVLMECGRRSQEEPFRTNEDPHIMCTPEMMLELAQIVVSRMP